LRSTIVDIARISGVSKATVDRVLNGRLSVRPETRQRVMNAAESLGYRHIHQSPTAPTFETNTIDVFLPAGPNSYIGQVRHEFIAQTGARQGVTANIHLIEGFDADQLAASLRKLVGVSKKVALVGVDHPVVREAVRLLSENGTRVVTIASDIHNVPRHHFAGVDNRAGGRLAGLLLGRLIRHPGKIAMLAGSRLYRAHEEREAGCKSILREEFKQFSVLDPVEVQDDYHLARTATLQLLHEHQDLVGIYSMGAGNRGVATALREAGRKGSIVVIAHDLTPHTREYLLDGTFDVILDQYPRVQVRDTITALIGPEGAIDPGHLIRIGVILRENIPQR
jgi:LacI family transcriptional regulator